MRNDVRVQTSNPHRSMERSSIDYGEVEILVLVLRKDGLVLLNEKEVREVAERLGFRVLGTVGLLIGAKQEELYYLKWYTRCYET